MLTTVDNPFNPFTHYDEWYQWDFNEGHHTPGLLARIVRTSDELSEADQEQAIDTAIDEILQDFPKGIYTKISD